MTRRERWAFLVALCAAVMAWPASVSARDRVADPRYLDQLVAEARRQGLSHEIMWHRLLHYRKGTLGGYKSEADAKSFFLSSEGRTDPEAELEATIRGLFGRYTGNEKFDHPYCRFPARLAWLNSRLRFDFSRLPRRACPRFQKFVEETRARSLTLVFSSYYLNNPSSAFGHTFLRIDKRTRRRDDTDLELLDYGIDFSATVDTGNAVIYAFKGLTGMFPGVFRRVPYYLKVREYSDHESRDLWEYELALTKDQVAMFLGHIWELGSNYFDYFYLSENCSYHLLGALEVANPKLRLLDRLRWPVLPADTIKAVMAEPGLVRRIRYRPSNRSQYRARVAELSGREVALLAAITSQPDTPFPSDVAPQSQARILDAALDLVDFRYAGELVREPGTKEDPESARFKQRLLERRAKLDTESEENIGAVPFREQPHLAHGSRRLGLGSGHSDERGWFHSLDMRLALHDLADSSLGYPDTMGIEFLPMRFRYYVESPKLELEDISIIRINSLTPLDRFEKTLSWNVDAGAFRIRDGACDGCLAAGFKLGGGTAFHLFTRHLLFFGFAEARVAGPVDEALLDFFRVGIGPAGGVRLSLGNHVHLLGTGHWSYLPGQEPKSTWQVDAAIRAEYTHDFALGIEATRQPGDWSARAVSYVYF